MSRIQSSSSWAFCAAAAAGVLTLLSFLLLLAVSHTQQSCYGGGAGAVWGYAWWATVVWAPVLAFMAAWMYLGQKVFWLRLAAAVAVSMALACLLLAVAAVVSIQTCGVSDFVG